MSTNPAQLQPFRLIALCVVVLLPLAALAAGVWPAVPAGAAAPLPRAAAAAAPPAAAAVALPATAQPHEALAALPQPVPVPVAPGTYALAAGLPAAASPVAGLPAAGGLLAALALVVVGALLLARVLRRAGPTPRAAAC
ncbi:MAG: hypothetical protein IT317_16250 [Anaerolineales bacterium]|nr:hypothetical protein [Anaerolineales bacterium]